MLELNIENDYITLGGNYDSKVIDIISAKCSYFVPNAEWSPKYQNKSWDGRISVFSKRNKTFPAGLRDIVLAELDSKKLLYKVNDIRKKPKKQALAEVDLGEHSFRDYQQKGIDIFKEKTRGILAMCTGAGKTKTSCGLISELSVYPVIFIVPSVSLLIQTVAEFRQSLKPLDESFEIGEIGGGKCNIAMNGVNVATYHTLLTAFDQKYSDKQKKIVTADKEKDSLQSLREQLKYLKIDYENSPKAKLRGIQTKIKTTERKIKEKEKFYQIGRAHV